MSDLTAYYTCRLCLGTTETMVDIDQKLQHFLSTCFSLRIFIGSQLPSKICQNCVGSLDYINQYRKGIIQSELMQLRAIKNAPINESEQFHSKLDELIKLFMVKEEDANRNIKELVHNEVIDIEDSDSNHSTDSALCEEINAQIDKRNKGKKIQWSSESVRNTSDTTKQNHKDVVENSNIESSNMTILSYDKADASNLNGDQNDTMNETMDSIDIDGRRVRRESESSTQILMTSYRPNVSFETSVRVENIHSPENSKDVMANTQWENLDINEVQNTRNDSPNIFNSANQSVPEKYVNVVLNDINEESNVDTGVTWFNDTSRNTTSYIIPDSPEVRGDLSCLTCLKVFESMGELSKHYRTVELSQADKSKQIQASRAFTTVITDYGKTVYKCKKCDKEIHQKGAIKRHLQIHRKDRPFLCNLCGRTYKSVQDILRHGAVHKTYYFVCTHGCGYRTVHLSVMRDHMIRHRKEFKYKCEKCGKCFQVKTWYEQHKNIHDNLRPFACNLCSSTFSMARYLTAHRANVHPQTSDIKRYRCNSTKCSLPCDSRMSLVAHMQKSHDVSTYFLCDECGAIRATSQKLVLHKKIHQVSKMFPCRFCKKAFNKKDHQRVHEKIHTGERLKCNNCPKSFTQRCSLRRHMKRFIRVINSYLLKQTRSN